VVGATQVSAGETSSNGHTCARLGDGAVTCWGSNSHGQLGGPAAWRRAGSGVKRAQLVRAGYEYSCALLAGGTVSCWGRNDKGQLGDGKTTDRAAPAAVPGVSGAVDPRWPTTRPARSWVTAACAAGARPSAGNLRSAPAAPPTAVAGIGGVAGIDAGYPAGCWS
jgi:hypothetical protein